MKQQKKRSKTQKNENDSSIGHEKRSKERIDTHSCDSEESIEDREFHIYQKL